MKLDKIDLASLPGLDTATGLFGSAQQAAANFDDRVVAMMVYVYETMPPDTLV